MIDVLGTRLLRALCAEKTFDPLVKAGIDDKSLFKECSAGLSWIKKYVEDNSGAFPTAKMVEETIGITLPEDLEPLSYVCDLVRKRNLSLSIETDLRKVIKLLDDRDPDKAFDALSETCFKLKASDPKDEIVSFRKSGPKRYEDYKASKATGGLVGIKTKWNRLNGIIQGWVNGTLNVVAAMSNTGKSWFCCISANDAEKEGKKVLLITLEMSGVRMQRRLDSIKYKLPFGKLKDAELDAITEDAWKKQLDDYASKVEPSDILIADKKLVRTVRDAYLLVIQHKPDIVIIDGGYRFEGDEKFGQWAKTVNIVNDLQLYAEITNIPWIVTTQFGDSDETGKEKKRGTKPVRAWNVRYGKEWFINPDILIGMYQDDDLRLIKKMEIWPLKVRDADRAFDMITINWDMESMDFSDTSGGVMEMVSSGSVTSVSTSHEITF